MNLWDYLLLTLVALSAFLALRQIKKAGNRCSTCRQWAPAGARGVGAGGTGLRGVGARWTHSLTKVNYAARRGGAK